MRPGFRAVRSTGFSRVAPGIDAETSDRLKAVLQAAGFPGLSGGFVFPQDDRIALPVDVGDCRPAEFARPGPTLPEGQVNQPERGRRPSQDRFGLAGGRHTVPLTDTGLFQFAKYRLAEDLALLLVCFLASRAYCQSR